MAKLHWKIVFQPRQKGWKKVGRGWKTISPIFQPPSNQVGRRFWGILPLENGGNKSSNLPTFQPIAIALDSVVWVCGCWPRRFNGNCKKWLNHSLPTMFAPPVGAIRRSSVMTMTRCIGPWGKGRFPALKRPAGPLPSCAPPMPLVCGRGGKAWLAGAWNASIEGSKGKTKHLYC